MAFTDNIKEITPALTELKDNTPVLIVGDKVFVGGIGGNSIPGPGITLGVVDADGKFQPLSFSGTTASNSGSPETVTNYKSWNTTIPSSGSSSSTSATKFYKCASVGTGTWTGYLATIDSTTGVWTFASTATTGLTYDKLTPVINYVYNETAQYRCQGFYTGGVPTEGLLLNMPLQTSIEDETGGTVTQELGSVSFTTVDNKQAAYFAGGSYLRGPAINLSNGDFTICFSARFNTSGAPDVVIYGFGGLYGKYSGQLFWYSPNTMLGTLGTDTWYHFIITGSSSSQTQTIYINNTQISTNSYYPSSGNYDSNGLIIGGHYTRSEETLHGYLADMVIYNRIVTAEEREQIFQLSGLGE